jgi:hypothetical protein
MRRDFSVELLRHGNDLDAALAAAARGGDYTAVERARDFAGAVQWNIRRAFTSSRAASTGPESERQ